MAVRALVIAIEDYPKVAGRRYRQAPAGHATGRARVQGLAAREVEGGGARPENDTQLIFCSEPRNPAGRAQPARIFARRCASSRTTARAPPKSCMSSSAVTGFRSASKPGKPCRHRARVRLRGASLIGRRLPQSRAMIAWLRDHLGPGRHYYFIDACRNKLDASQIQIGPLLPIDPQAPAEARPMCCNPRSTAPWPRPVARFLPRSWRDCGARARQSMGRCAPTPCS